MGKTGRFNEARGSESWVPARPAIGGRLRAVLFDSMAWICALGIAVSFIWLVSDIVIQGAQSIDLQFLTEAPERSGRSGGISSILASTALILGVCLLVSVPLGVGTAIFLAEACPYDSRSGKLIRTALDVLAGVPSIVFGLFGNAFFCVFLGMGFSILSGGLTLACMVLPILTRSVEVGLRTVPNEYRVGAAALDLSKTRVLFSILLPASTPGLIAGLLLGIGRAMAETAALLFTSGYVDRMPDSIHDSGRSMSIHIYELAMNVPGGEANAYGTALILILILIVVNFCAARFVNRMGALGVFHA